jgi:hypothetical protein
MEMITHAELINDPVSLGYTVFVATRNDEALTALVNDKTKFTKLGWITVAGFKTWCAGHNSEYVNIETVAGNNTSPYYAIAKILLSSFNSSVTDQALNLSDSNILGMLNTWPFVDTTGASKATLIAFGTFQASRADILAVSASLSDVSDVLNRGY